MIVRDAAALVQAMDYSRHTVRSLALATGATRSTIGHLRSGRRTYCRPALALSIAEAVKMPLDFLFVAEPTNDSQVAEGEAA